ncbi:UDP-N-acetylmuramate dehydrogenase [Aquimarina sp. BL5]|uniref:UDP-N-acetylmuramate dehydrogenase n=1 Tax=Aquimarina sp. BL5 TaxID=1714860 RepID=UPI000E46A522|nr:UDP-N-acetylmuramate dehydrogenase [Aquimarina sp. BL5]AXT53126.1 UDP-N-acetylmuramate dehydrogenase [Aquimarina sp. BL5]RKM94281.1 UDP-N-acetylmuramate dehydrogenase [Aquimarina sp. BL5]
MKIERNKSLKKHNTFGINVKAAEFIKINSEKELTETLSIHKERNIFILSGGSNMLLTQNLEALVLHIAIKGITTSSQPDSSVLVSANAGENWHDFVQFCIDNDFGGLENLSLIPGYVGSAPIQNIGAYGVELKDSFISCEAIHVISGAKKHFTKEECNFGYRNSIFKNELKGNYIITKVTFRLTTKDHVLNTSYGAIENALKEKNITSPTIKDISEAVIAIRKSKLPDPKEIGNSGSFFKNPVITSKNFAELQKLHPDIPFYQVDKNNTKIPAGWLIEQSGFKGKRWGDAGVHAKQALVLVNYDNASGQELLELSKRIQKTVKEKFGIILETEVNII